ncbi:hypothetical protein CBM2587_B90265 [Cupriavidus taiwanensis]|uniref:Uncharacterized protein n=1 Tax=Cupriavidus taiwanensis TaxID=164546 RepID=A0A976A895_9BURK|nr:hypothetical protein CBM2587_B90265 [Cupriavidus taiwanensis]
MLCLNDGVATESPALAGGTFIELQGCNDVTM